VLLEVDACAVCGTDVRIVTHGHAKVQAPQVLGHEVVGRVAEADAAGLEPGLRVTVAPAIGCGECRWCREGRPNRCADLRTIGYYYPGAFARWLPVPAEAVRQGSLCVVPDELPDPVACLVEPLACCLNGQELVDVGEGDRVVVVGAGPIGVLHARLASARGAAQVMVVEQRPERCEQARALGLAEVLQASSETAERLAAMTGGEGADVVIAAAPSAAVQAECLAWLGRGGRASFFAGLPPQQPPVPIDTNRIHYQELFVAGAHGSTPQHNRDAMALLAAGQVAVDDLVTGCYDLESAPEAVAVMGRGEGLKSVVVLSD
jgi:L-iditol 2-dehydrogenase